MVSRRLNRASFIVVVLLVGAICHPGALTDPYSGSDEPYTIAHESTEAFNETVNDGHSNPYPEFHVTELSEGERRAFEKAKEQPATSSGEQSLGTVPVCDDTLLLCNEYEEFPNPSSDGNKYTIVVDATGERYLVREGYTGAYTNWNLDPVIEFIIKLLTLGPLALFLGHRTLTASPPQPTRVTVGIGAVIAILAFGYPYIVMFA